MKREREREFKSVQLEAIYCIDSEKRSEKTQLAKTLAIFLYIQFCFPSPNVEEYVVADIREIESFQVREERKNRTKLTDRNFVVSHQCWFELIKFRFQV